MKITQAKDYKKPLYAVGIAAALTALAVTGCGDNPGKSGKSVDYAGDIQVVTEYSKPDGDIVELAGATDVYTEPTDETVETESRYSDPDDDVRLDGGVEFYEP